MEKAKEAMNRHEALTFGITCAYDGMRSIDMHEKARNLGVTSSNSHARLEEGFCQGRLQLLEEAHITRYTDAPVNLDYANTIAVKTIGTHKSIPNTTWRHVLIPYENLFVQAARYHTMEYRCLNGNLYHANIAPEIDLIKS